MPWLAPSTWRSGWSCTAVRIDGLTVGEHTVQIVKRSGQYTTLDGFKVTD
ncbi:hypothetical protein ACWC9U_34910 [Streptomyces sp. 900116325]